MTCTTTPTWCSPWPTAPRVRSPPGSATRCWPRGTPSAGSPRTPSGWPAGAGAPPRRGRRASGRQLASNKFAVIFAVLLAVAISGFILLALAGPAGSDSGYSAGNVLYLGIMDLTGSALTSPGDHGAEKMAQVLLTGDGMALLPVVTALIVGARLTGRIRGEPKPGDGHVIVVGGGEVGVRVLGGLYALGFHAVLIDQDPNARGVAFARNHRLPVVIGDSCDEKTLRHAGIKGALAGISVTKHDILTPEHRL